MFCKNCGKSLNPGEKFCGNCGAKVVSSDNITQNMSEQTTNNNNINQQNIYSQRQEDTTNQVVNNVSYQENYAQNQNLNNNQIRKNSSWQNTISIVIGIVTLASVFIFQIFTMPLSIIGIVFGVLSFKNNKKHKIGLILNIISFAIAIPIFMLYSSIFESRPINPTIGTWDCKSFNNGDNENLDYIITMKLNNENKFMWNKYNDAKNNHVIGTYEFTDLHKTNNNGSASYYSIKLIGEEYVNDGVLQTESYISEYEMGIAKNTDEAVLMNIYTYNIYYCYRSDKSSPVIEANYSNDYKPEKENNIRVNKLTYKLPSSLSEGSLNTDTYKSYTYMNSNSFCQFRVNVYPLFRSLSIQEYFEDYVYDTEKNLSNIYTKNINGTEWNMLDVDGEYSNSKYGVYIDDDNAYGIEFSITDDYNNECAVLYNNIIESIKIN